MRDAAVLAAIDVMAALRPDAIAAADVALELRDGALSGRRGELAPMREEGCAA